MLDSKIIFSHPTGNSNVRGALKGILDAGLLDSFYTTIACFSGNTFDKLSHVGPFSEFNRRRFEDALQPYTKLFPLHELCRLIAGKAGMNSLIKNETGQFCVDTVYRQLDMAVARGLKNIKDKKITGVYAYEDGALHSFSYAKKIGLKCFYDLPIGYWRSARKLMASEMEVWPEWAATLTGMKDSENKLSNKDEELGLSDRIYVASTFTAGTLDDYPGTLAPVTIIPYGFPDTPSDREYAEMSGRKLKLLFVGGLSQRKGIANLFAAMESFNDYIALTLVGRKANDDCKALDEALKKHSWIPGLSHSKILNLMRQHDVLIFPSLFEGFGLVITEAMSQGTPVITTERTAGPDLIEHGLNGWIIEAGSVKAIENILSDILKDTGLVSRVGMAAMETARKRSWSHYGNELATALKTVI